MNVHRAMASAHVNRPAPTQLGHTIVDVYLVMLCKVMVTIVVVSRNYTWTLNCTHASVEPPPYQTLMSVAAQAVDWDCANRYVSMSLAHFTVTAMKAMC